MTDATLIQRLEAATGPSRELDAEIERAVQRCDPGAWYDAKEDCLLWDEERDFGSTVAYERCGQYLPDYTASIDAALTLVPDGMEYEITTLYGIARVAVGLNAEPGPFYAEDPSGNVAIALCIAAIKARGLS